MEFGTGFKSLAEIPNIQALELTQVATGNKYVLKNEPGKKASVKIYYAISHSNNFKITPAQAQAGLDLYGDYVQQERQQPNSHPNIRLLLETIAQNSSWLVKII